jgi:hypothetical protein
MTDKNFEKDINVPSKGIIIDGIDVSGCNFILERDGKIKCECCHATGFGVICDCGSWKTCDYKNYKRKEQEYEELRQYHNKCCEEFEKEKKEWSEKYNQVSRDFYDGKYCDKENCSLLQAKEQECDMWKNLTVDNGAVALKYQQQLDQLKAENEELEETIDGLLKVQYQLADSNKKLRECLAEIKEIVKEQLPTVNYNFAKSMHPEMFNCYEQILQKISEVEDEK